MRIISIPLLSDTVAFYRQNTVGRFCRQSAEVCFVYTNIAPNTPNIDHPSICLHKTSIRKPMYSLNSRQHHITINECEMHHTLTPIWPIFNQ